MAKIGNRYFDSLEEAISASTSTDTILLTSDTTFQETFEIHKTVNIDLNNHTIRAPEKVFLVYGGSLNLSGVGKIVETKPNYGAIMIVGSSDPTKKDFSTVSIGSGITLEGWSGIFINHQDKTSYGVLVNMNGTINAISDTSGGAGIGIYVNGNIKHQDNSPIVNLSKTAKITSNGNGIYSAGYATYNINGASISGDESALAIKSGIFNIYDGKFTGTGEDKTPTTGNNNGINPSGAAIQMESNSKYAGDIELYIKDGQFESKNGNVIYEYTTNDVKTKVKNISITGGTYIAKQDKNVFTFSDSFKNSHSGFITGGVYSSDPSLYLKSGYSALKNSNSLYEVGSSTMDVFLAKDAGSVNLWDVIGIVAVIGILGFVVYFYRDKFKRH